MSLQRPIMLNMSSTTGYRLQFDGGHASCKVVQKGAGEVYVSPIIDRPTQAFATTSASSIAAGQDQTMIVASATNITVGSMLTINDANAESVLVRSISGTTITADFRFAHDGTAVPLAVTGFVFPAVPSVSPAVAAGQARQGWYDLAADAANVDFGIKSGAAAGSPLFPGPAFDQTYGLLIYCVTATNIQVLAH